MSDTSSWYKRKLASARSGAPMPSTRQQPAQPQQFVPFQRQQLDMFNQPVREPINIHNLWGAMQTWQGGKAHRIDNEPCPECGSDKYYSRTEGARRGPPPAPHCFACGYNGLFTQGLQTTWQGGG